MIVKQFYETRDDNVNLYRIYSDSNHYIEQEQTNAVYEEVIDIEDAPYTYVEAEDLIPTPEPTQEERNTALDVMMGQAE